MTAPREKILYLDDEPINCLVFERAFQKHFDVVTALSGHEALTLLETDEDIDQVVSDIKMPVMDGFEFLERARSRHADKKYYLLSGFDQPPEATEALEAGEIVAYFRKPMDRKHILSYLAAG